MARLFGRERELAAGDAFLESARDRFRVLALEGEAGIGKTMVWREIVQRAEERGFQVLSCRPAETETKLALSAVADLFEPVANGPLAALPEPQRRALEVAMLRAEPGTGPLDPRTLATAVRSLVTELSAEGPLLVAIDDVQWLDATSGRVLEFALRRLVGTPLGWLFARRLPERGVLASDALVPPESLTRVTVGPLSVAAVHHLIKERLEHALPRPALVRVHEASGGNPFYALEIVRELLGAREPITAATPLPVPDELREFLAARLRRLPARTREALLAASALSTPTTTLVDEQALTPAEERDIVRVDPDGRIAFRHPLYASAVYGSAPSARRRELHARLAEHVRDVEERARHLALATSQPDEEVARKLEQGARLAGSRGAWGSAAELFERARSLTPSAQREDAGRRGIAAAEYHVHAGDRSRARALVEATLAEPLPRSLRADALRLLAEISYNDESFVEAERLFTEALESADEPRLALRIQLGLAYVDSNRWQFASGRTHAYRAVELAETIGDGPHLAHALAYCAMFDYLCGHGVDWDKVERSLQLEDADTVMPLQSRPSVIAACLVLYVGRLSDARDRLTRVRNRASDYGDESDLAFVLLWLSWLETRSGDLGRAAALAKEAASFATLTGSESMHAWALTQQALVDAHRGDVTETRRGCAEAAGLVERSGNLLPGIWIAASLGLLELSLGNPEAAWEACEPLTEALGKQGIGEPVIPFFLPDALEALIALGELDRADALLSAFEERGRELDRTWALATAGRCRALLLAARGDLGGAGAALEQTLVEHQRLEMPFELARTLLVKGVIERRVRRRARSKESFEQALASFEAIGAALWAERARQELARLGLRRASGGELTSAEERVAELAAQGLTNREMAAALFISPKTVEANLSRIYRKLGIASRAELGARMAELTGRVPEPSQK